jgi:uncharacterized protein (DUF362 family)/NAD-dependent dihydropyrimidine dehydrogenase PreA subunit
MSKVMIHPATYETVRQAVDWAFGLFPLQVKGKSVLIKPNVLRASTPEEGITTHPALVRAVVEKIESMSPASIVVGDNPGLYSYGADEESFRRSGLMEAAKGHYRNIGNDAQKVDFNREFMPSVSLSRIVLDADIVISLPKFKTHGLSVVTGAIKNSYGFLPGAQKARLHRAAGCAERFHEMLVDVFQLRVPDLFIVDAVVGMDGNGPAGPDLRDIGLILASDNGVALDAVIAVMMGLEPGRLRFLQKAKEAGLGDYDLDTIEVIGELRRLPDFKLPLLGGEAVLQNPDTQAIIHNRTLMRPRTNPELCTGCGTCVDQCPVSALSMGDHVPEVDADTCITCFCCQEVCPEKAITLQ